MTIFLVEIFFHRNEVGVSIAFVQCLKEEEATQAKVTGKRQQNTWDSKVNVETVECIYTEPLIFGTSSRPQLKVKARARESRNPKWLTIVCHSHLHITHTNGIPLRKAMVMAGECGKWRGWKVHGNDGAERQTWGSRSFGWWSASNRRSGPGWTACYFWWNENERILLTLEPPTDAVRMARNETHVPFRDWCPICVASRGRSSPHRRVAVNKTADTLPKFQTDNMFIRTVVESKTQPCITFVETRSGVLISFICARKGG